ncbi:MAG: SDR family oxidoreductase [Alphaproteobacteria bacterium]|nr:SDR family oxidoreductase [Alphaproteobacteria bacterium]
MADSEARTVLLTGASRGIGHATVQRFVAEGWRIISCSRDDVPAECRVPGSRHVHIAADLADPLGVAALIERGNAVLAGAALHALVNNAGVSPKAEHRERLGCLNGDLAHWRQVFELNFFTPLALARGFAAALHRGSGVVVNVTSIAGHLVHPFAGSAYATSKAALSALTREMAAEFAHLGVRVNAVAPGEIETAMLSPETEILVPRIPLARLGQPEEVAGTIYYLCSDDARYVTGTEIMITGGQHLF